MSDTLNKIRSEFTKVRQLLENEESEQKVFERKHKAIKTMQNMVIELSDLRNNKSDGDDTVIIMLAVIHSKLGILYGDTDDLKAAEQEFMKCIELLKGKEKCPKAILPLVGSLNQLGIIWYQWSQPLKAKELLERAEKIYKDYVNQPGEFREPMHTTEAFGLEPVQEKRCAKDILESAHTLNLYYLAQVHCALEDHHKSAAYCHRTLSRQLESSDDMEDIDRIDYIDWVLNAATLSQFFLDNDDFPQARHHLATSSYMLKEYENALKKKYLGEEETEISKAKWEQFKHRSADVARCWAKYGILLMTASRKRLLQKAETEDDDDGEEEKKDQEKKVNPHLTFQDLQEKIEPIANQITDKYLLDFNDARGVFLNVKKWLESAQSYYTLENHASDYVLIAQDMSQAYKYLAFFEELEETQAKMHKRRVDILEAVVKELNPQYYKVACQEIWMELGEAYAKILDIKLDRVRSSKENPKLTAVRKINHLAANAIKNFQAFVDSATETRTPEKMVARLPEDLEAAVLVANFNIGATQNKFMTLDKKQRLENVYKSIKAFQFVADYGKRFPEAMEISKEKFALCQETLTLLPLQAAKLRQQIANE